MTKIEPFILTFSIGFFLNSRFCIEKSKFEFYIKFWSRNMYNEGYIMSAQNDKISLPNVTKILKCVLTSLSINNYYKTQESSRRIRLSWLKRVENPHSEFSSLLKLISKLERKEPSCNALTASISHGGGKVNVLRCLTCG